MKLRTIHLIVTAAAALVFGAVTVQAAAAAEVAQPTTNPADNLLRLVTRFTYVNSSCALVFKVPLTRSLVIQNISSYMTKTSNAQSGEFVFWSDANCSQLVGAATTEAGHITIDHNYGTGLALAQGSGLYVSGYQAIGSITMVGYLIQSTDANIDGPIYSNSAPAHRSGISPLLP